MLAVVFYAGLVSLTSPCPSPLSPYSLKLFVLGGVFFFFLPPGFCYVCVCVGLARLFYGIGYLVFVFRFLAISYSCVL